MLRITIPERDLFDEEKQEFIYVKRQTIDLEHSLVSLSKWESKWKKPFISKDEKNEEETLDYIKCMTITQNVDPNAYKAIPDKEILRIKAYIEDPMTATWFSNKDKGRRSNEQVTAELIYYWMIALTIPMECQKWHLNRLLTLIKVCNAKNEPPKKMSRRDALSRQAQLNASRRKRLGTRG